MAPLYTGGHGRSVFCLAWKWTVMLLLMMMVTKAVQRQAEGLYPSAQSCQMDNITLQCTLTDDGKLYRLDNFKWNGIEKVIIKNATELTLKDPDCTEETKKKEVEVFFSSKVTTESGTNCSQQLILHNSKNVKITDGVDLVRMFNTEADEVNLPEVKQFDLKDSYVRQVSVRVVGQQSTITGSKIDTVKKLEIDGSFKFTVSDSILETVEGFVHDSTEDTVFTNVTIGSILQGGFRVSSSQVTIKDSTVKNVSPLGLTVEVNAKLVIENSVIVAADYNSLEISLGSQVLFKNVTVVNEKQISFHLLNANFSLFPLALSEQFHTWLTPAYVAMFVVLGVAAGCVLATLSWCIFQKRKKYKNVGEATELIARDQPATPPQPDKSNTKNKKNRPLPPKNPLPELPKPAAKTVPADEEYTMYNDVAPTPPTIPPPFPAPDESSSTGGSTLPSTTPMKQPKYPHWIPPKKPEGKDDRDQLPPPPCLPEEEEIYEDLMDDSACTRPKLPPPNKMKKPPIFKGPLPPVPPKRN